LSDTLVGLAVKYRVSVGEIKRKNRLLSDSDIFTRRQIFIPPATEETRNESVIHKPSLHVLFHHGKSSSRGEQDLSEFGILERRERQTKSVMHTPHIIERLIELVPLSRESSIQD